MVNNPRDTPLRLMQVMAGGQQGGAEAFFVRLSTALADAGVESRAVIRANPERREALMEHGITVAELPFGGWFDFSTGRRLEREITAFAPDIVLSWMNRAARFVPRPAGIAGLKRPFVHVGRLGGYYALKYYRSCDHLIGNTQDIVDHIVRAGWPAARAHYLPNFADESTAPAVPRADLATPEGVPLFVALGRLHPNKGFDVLLEAMAMLPDAHLWLAGEGPLKAALAAQAARLGIVARVRFLGWRDDVAALMAAADALVCPSRHEPLGNVVIEAWARRLPVIASDAQGPAALIEDGRTGLLVPREDAGALAAAMAHLAAGRELAARLAHAGRDAYLAQFSKRAVVERYLAFFDRISAGDGSRAVTDSVAQG